MIVKNIVGLALVGILSISHANAATTLTQWGAIATISNADCVNDYCGSEADLNLFYNSLSVDPINGGIGEADASVATGSWPAPYSAQASGTVAGDLSVPLMTAGASSGENAWIAGQALVVQGYEYTGGGTETLQLDWNLSGTIVNPDSDPITGLAIFLGFFKSDDPFAFPDVSDPLSTLTLFAGLEGLNLFDQNFFEYADAGPVSDQGTLNIDVNGGDEFYLVMGLMAAAGGSVAMAESLSTLTASFDGNPPLVPAITAIPVLPAVWLFGSGLLGLIGITIRKKAA